MGVREREKWDLPLGQGAALAALSVLFLAGGAAGCFLSGLISGESAQPLSDFLSGYLSLAAAGPVPRDLCATVWGYLRWLLAAVLLGFTAIGVVGLPLLFGIRGFLFTFSAGCFLRVFGTGGLLPVLALLGMPALLWAPALFLAGFQGMTSAHCLLRRGMGDSRCPLPFSVAYWLRLGLCAGLTLACAGVEYFLVPILVRAAARAVL